MNKNILDQLKLFKNLFEKNNVQKLYLTWSFARGDENVDSDIDLIYSIKNWKRFSLFNIWDLVLNLERKLWRKVDLVENNSVKPELKKYLEKDKILIF